MGHHCKLTAVGRVSAVGRIVGQGGNHLIADSEFYRIFLFPLSIQTLTAQMVGLQYGLSTGVWL